MALVLKDRVKETTTTSGTGTVTLAGAAAGFQSFSVIGNGNTTYYAIADPITGDWEVGLGTYSTTGPTLTRTTVLESSNSGSLVNFAANTKDVFCTYPAERSMYVDGSSIVPGTSASLPVVYGGTGQTTYTNGQLLIGNTTGNTLTKATLTAGTGISVTNGAGSITIAATNNGTVTSVSGTGSYGGLSLSGTVTSSGSLTFGGTPTGTWPIDISGNAATATSATSATTATNATNVTLTTSSTASAFKVPFANTTVSTTGNYGLLQDSLAEFTYNPSTNTLTAGTFSGALSGNATTATTLQTARTINGVSFNGSANITVTANTTNTLTRGSYLTGSNFNGSAATTWAVDATTTATASKVVARDASGYIFGTYYNGTGTFPVTASANTSGMATFTGTNGTDNYGRGYTAAAAASLLSGQTMNIAGNATTATTLQTARTINGVSFNGSANITVEPYIEDDNTTNATRYVVFTDNSTAGYKRLNEDSSFYYNPSTNTLTAGVFSGSGASLTNLPIGVFPFYKYDGTNDNINLVNNTALPFYDYTGATKNITLVSA